MKRENLKKRNLNPKIVDSENREFLLNWIHQMRDRKRRKGYHEKKTMDRSNYGRSNGLQQSDSLRRRIETG